MSRKTLQLFIIALVLLSGFALPGHAEKAAAKPSHKAAETSADKDDQDAPAHPDGVKPAAQQPQVTAQPQPSAATAEMAAQQQATAQPGEPGDEQAASTEAKEPRKIVWPFSGMKGYLDKQSVQRGFQIYSQVCSACHSIDLVTYRSLSQIGFTEGEVKALAAQKQVEDENDNGERIQRPAKPFDHIVPPFPNEKASRAANNGAYPPDLSLIVKAREHGPDYVYSILTGFGNPPANEAPVTGKYYNPYFQGHWISMPPPLHETGVTYQDGTPATIDQMARDVVTFLEWAAEPEMQQRHEMGVKVLIFLGVMTILLYAAKKRIWKKIKH